MRLNRERAVGTKTANLVDLSSTGICKTVFSDAHICHVQGWLSKLTGEVGVILKNNFTATSKMVLIGLCFLLPPRGYTPFTSNMKHPSFVLLWACRMVICGRRFIHWKWMSKYSLLMLLFCKRLQLKPRLCPLAPSCRMFLPSLVGLPNFGLRSHKFRGKSRSKVRGHLFQLNEASAAHRWKKSGRESRLESQKQVVAFCEQGTFPNSHIIIIIKKIT